MYLKKKELAKKYSISLRTVDRIYKAMTESREYRDKCMTIGGRVRIDEGAFDRAVRNR